MPQVTPARDLAADLITAQLTAHWNRNGARMRPRPLDNTSHITDFGIYLNGTAYLQLLLDTTDVSVSEKKVNNVFQTEIFKHVKQNTGTSTLTKMVKTWKAIHLFQKGPI